MDAKNKGAEENSIVSASSEVSPRWAIINQLRIMSTPWPRRPRVNISADDFVAGIALTV